MDWLREEQGGVRVEVHVVPRAAKSAVVGVHGDRLKVALAAPPVDGAANRALIAFFARALRVRERDVALLRGERSRKKTLAIAGASAAALRALVP
jgi:hypothetical protein